jgi:hypothetical protein
MITALKIRRAWCRLVHWRYRLPHNGFGWTGHRCGKCGWMFFGEWDEGIFDTPPNVVNFKLRRLLRSKSPWE